MINPQWRDPPFSKANEHGSKDVRAIEVRLKPIMKTRLFKYIENFTTKNWKFSDKILIFYRFLLKT